MRAEIQQLDPQLAMFNAVYVADLLSRSIVPQCFNFIMLGLAYGVVRRVREFGARMSRGADAGRIVQLVLSHGLKLVGLGIVIGLATFVPAARASRVNPVAALRGVVMRFGPSAFPCANPRSGLGI